VSFSLRQLEAELGVSLLLRTTRRLALTAAGDTFYRRSVTLLQDAQGMLDDVQRDHRGLTGELHITSTPEYGVQMIIPALTAFQRRHPDLRIRHVASTATDDLISGRFDVAIRLGRLADSTHRAALLDRFAILPVASPEWLNHHPVDSLSALAQADWIVHNRLTDPLRWQLSGPDGQRVPFEITRPVRFSADSAAALMAFALQGNGVALLPAWLVSEAIERGSLCHLLPDYAFPMQGIYAVYPDTRHVAEKVRGFIDFLRQRIALSAGQGS
ncbi:MAG: LysR substrate-binding domain-containing protein, partial [Pantoea sp.]|nr:LysR substrate-binding domain-containing protein [Pantoea sp.]